MGDSRTIRGRPRGFDEDAALEAAMLTFWRKGYRQTSLDDLVEATGASRASLYEVFGDKRTIFIQCLDLYGERFSERMRAVMADEPDGKRALAIILNASADRLTSSDAVTGCLRCESTLALMGSDSALDQAIKSANTKYLQNLKNLCARSVRNGDLNASEGKSLPLFMSALVSGMVTLARGGASRKDLAIVVERALANWPDRPAQ